MRKEPLGVSLDHNDPPVHQQQVSEGSPQSGDASSGSPPDSSGSGPTYSQLNYNENIKRSNTLQKSTVSI